MGSLFNQFCRCCNFLHEKKHAEIEARKLMIFGRLFGGAGGSGEACLAVQILQNGAAVQSRPAPPSGVRRILSLRLCRRPPCLPVNWGLAALAKLGGLVGLAGPADCYKGSFQVPKSEICKVWRAHFGTLGHYFGD